MGCYRGRCRDLHHDRSDGRRQTQPNARDARDARGTGGTRGTGGESGLSQLRVLQTSQNKVVVIPFCLTTNHL